MTQCNVYIINGNDLLAYTDLSPCVITQVRNFSSIAPRFFSCSVATNSCIWASALRTQIFHEGIDGRLGGSHVARKAGRSRLQSDNNRQRRR